MDYDIRAVFEEMELELIASMRRNLARHQRWEAKEGINWTMWQAEQLKTLEQFKRENKKIFEKKFDKVNKELKSFLASQYERAGFDQERLILEALTNGRGISDEIQKGLDGAFFSLNKKKMNALINASMNDLEKAEHAMLRKTNDEYRKIIYKSQAMANSGAFTLNQCVDKASKDFLRNGIACIQYKDGRMVNIASYAEMAIRTANKRAVLVSEGDVRNAYGIHTVKISSYNQCSKVCLPWQGKIYVDDVYSGGTKEEAQEKKLKTISEAMEGGLFHPNCRHRASTYFWDIEQELENYDDEGNEIDPKDQEHRRNHLKIQQYKRMETGFLDEKNRQEAKENKEFWIEKDEALDNSVINEHSLVKRIGNNEVNFDYIHSEDYRKKFSKITQYSNVNDAIRKYAESMLVHRTNSDYEDLYIISGKTGKLLFRNAKSTSVLEVQVTKEELRKIKELREPLIGIHNHPTNILPTGSDFVAAGYRGYEFGIVVTHDGRIFKYGVGNKSFLPELLDGRVDKYMQTPYNLNIEKAQLKALNEFREEYDITWEEIKSKF